MIVSHPGWPDNIWCQRGGMLLKVKLSKLTMLEIHLWTSNYELLNIWISILILFILVLWLNSIQWTSSMIFFTKKRSFQLWKETSYTPYCKLVNLWLAQPIILDIRISNSTDEHTHKLWENPFRLTKYIPCGKMEYRLQTNSQSYP